MKTLNYCKKYSVFYILSLNFFFRALTQTKKGQRPKNCKKYILKFRLKKSHNNRRLLNARWQQTYQVKTKIHCLLWPFSKPRLRLWIRLQPVWSPEHVYAQCQNSQSSLSRIWSRSRGFEKGRSSEHDITENNGFHLVSLLPPSVPKVPYCKGKIV